MTGNWIVNMRFWYFSLLFMLSGISGLIYQVVWAKKLQLSFGITSFAVSAVLAAYFLGLALGSYLGGKLSVRLKRPLLAYGIVELLIGLLSIYLTPYMDSLDLLLRPFSALLDDHFWTLQSARFLLSILVLLLPTTLLGMTVPLMTCGLVTRLEIVGSRVATLYAVNTFGAVIGVIIAGFYLVETYGLHTTVLLAGSLSIFVGILSFVGHIFLPLGDAGDLTVTDPILETRLEPIRISILLPVMGISGAMGIGLEVLWTRLIIQNLSTTAYVFSAILAIFLIGISLGSFIVKRQIDKWTNLTTKLAVCEVSVGLLTLLGLPVLDWIMLPAIFHVLHIFGYDLINDHGVRFLAWLAWSASLLLPITIFLGATFPLASRLISTDVKTVGERIGRLYAMNTLGGVFGAVIVGFIFMPHLGIYGTILFISFTQAGLAITLAASAKSERKQALTTISIPVAFMFIVVVLLPTDFVRARVIRQTPGTVIHYDEDYYGTIVVYEEGSGRNHAYGLSVNGISYSGTGKEAVRYMRLQGHLPIMMYPGEAHRGLVICHGVGLTAGAMSIHPNLELTVVELSKAILELSDHFSEVNENVSHADNVQFVIDDGRNYLLRHESLYYDIVTLEPPPPYHAGMSNLYSQEFYEIVRDHLTPDGVAAQWIPLHVQSQEDTRMLIATFQKVFPHSTLWWTETNETLVLGTMSNTPLRPGHLQNMFLSPRVKRSLNQIGLDDEIGLASLLLLDSTGLRKYTAGAQIMTDDLPIIEYAYPTTLNNPRITIKNILAHRVKAQQVAELLGLPPARISDLVSSMKDIERSRLR